MDYKALQANNNLTVVPGSVYDNVVEVSINQYDPNTGLQTQPLIKTFYLDEIEIQIAEHAKNLANAQLVKSLFSNTGNIKEKI